jgi:transcriptional regulator with XRE-family HTH domain
MRPLVQWLATELEQRRWSYNELARQAGVSSAAVSMVMTGQQNPGVDFCRGVAKALNAPPERVFRLAGLLPHRPERDELVDELLFYYDHMTPESQAHFRLIARAFAEGSGQVEELQEARGRAGDALAPA